MTTTEIAVVIGGAFLGFWIVSSFLAPKTKSEKTTDQSNSKSESSKNKYQNSGQSSGEQNADYTKNANIDAIWYQILEIDETASREDIIKAYRYKMHQYHPDKVANLGPELKELAENKTKQINAAYEYALKLRG